MILEHKKIQSLDDYFIELSKRKEKGVYFYRINGTSEEIKRFLYKYYDAAGESGVIIEGKIANPTEGNLSYYNEMMGTDFQMSVEFISAGLKKWLPRMSEHQRETVSASIFDSLDNMRNQGKNENMLKNAYIKFMCWLYYKFERIINRIGQENIPKILYEGSISKYELLLISMLSNAGCDVILLQKDGDGEYLKLDPDSRISYEFENSGLAAFSSDFSMKKLYRDMESVDIKASGSTVEAVRPKLNINISGAPGTKNKNNFTQNTSSYLNEGSTSQSNKEAVYRCTNAWIEGKGLEDILQSTAMRGNDNSLFYNVYCRINGVEDRITYANELYQFFLSLQNAKRHVVIVNQNIPKPTTDEIMKIKRANYVRLEQLLAGLQANIQYPANPELREIMVEAFESVITEESKEPGISINKLTNKAVYLLCWLKRYQSELFHNWKKPDIGCFIYFGGCKDLNEAMFMRFLSRIPVDVLILCPNLNERCRLEDRLLYEINNPNSMNLGSFPERGAGLHIGTAAYHAERDLDDIMYNDNVVFRDQQFTKANVICLQTMDREIKILWNNDLKFRPNFSTVDGVVNIPVIFSKLSGVKDKKIDEYWISIKQLMTPETIVIDRAPFITSTTPNPIKMYATEFFKNGKLQRNRIRNHQSYQYGFLREEMQEHILDKLESLIEQRLIKGTFENGTEYTIISVALNMPKNVTRLIQKFDFVKKNPKLIYVNTSESLISLEDSIYVTFLNMIGFDVVFFVPTGYNTENHFNKKIMEEHQIGDYVYDLQVPNWDTVPLSAQKSWRDKFFKKG